MTSYAGEMAIFWYFTSFQQNGKKKLNGEILMPNLVRIVNLAF